MYEDDPQEKVFDVFGEAVFGDDPLGRAIIGRAAVIAETPAPRSPPSTASRYVPGNIVIAAAGAVDHDALVELASDADRIPAGDRTARPRTAADRPSRGSAAAVRAQGHRAVPRLPRRAGALAPRRAPLRAARAGHDLRRHLVVAAVSGDPRAPRARVRGLLVHQRLPRHRPGRPVPGYAARQPRARRSRSSARSCAGCARSPPPSRSSTARRRTSRAGSCSRWSRPARG